jgi:hypothetical protein
VVRLPTVGGDSGNWGTILNGFLEQEHDADGTHGTITPTDIKAHGPWVDVRNYASINAAVTAIGSTETTLLVPNAQTLAGNLTTPSTLTLKILQGGSIVKASTHTLTINGPFEAGLYQVFSGFSAGDVTGLGNAEAIWFGTTGLQHSISALSNGGVLNITPGYTFTGSSGSNVIKIDKIRIVGHGRASKVNWSGDDIFKLYDSTDVTNSIDDIIIENVWINRAAGAGGWHKAHIAIVNNGGSKRAKFKNNILTTDVNDEDVLGFEIYDVSGAANSQPLNVEITGNYINLNDTAIKATNATKSGMAIHVKGGASVEFLENTVEDCGGVSVAAINIDKGDVADSGIIIIRDNELIDCSNSTGVGLIHFEGVTYGEVGKNIIRSGPVSRTHDKAIQVASHTVKVEENLVIGSSGEGITFFSNFATPVDYVCKGNTIINAVTGEVGTFSGAIAVNATATNEYSIDNMIIEGNKVFNSKRPLRIYSNTSGGAVITNLSVVNNYFESIDSPNSIVNAITPYFVTNAQVKGNIFTGLGLEMQRITNLAFGENTFNPDSVIPTMTEITNYSAMTSGVGKQYGITSQLRGKAKATMALANIPADGGTEVITVTFSDADVRFSGKIKVLGFFAANSANTGHAQYRFYGSLNTNALGASGVAVDFEEGSAVASLNCTIAALGSGNKITITITNAHTDIFGYVLGDIEMEINDGYISDITI